MRGFSVFSLNMQVQFSRLVMSNSLRPHGLQHARLPCLSPTPRAYSNSCPLCRWCHPTISSSVVPFSSCPQSFLASGSCPVSLSFASGGQSICLEPYEQYVKAKRYEYEKCNPNGSTGMNRAAPLPKVVWSVWEQVRFCWMGGGWQWDSWCAHIPEKLWALLW